jgi:hypothetical protein
MPTVMEADGGKLNEEITKRIIEWALNSKRRQPKPESITLNVKEIQREYGRALNKILFDYTMGVHDPVHGNLFSFLDTNTLEEFAALPQRYGMKEVKFPH